MTVTGDDTSVIGLRSMYNVDGTKPIEVVEQLQKDIGLILCKLEHIFSHHFSL